MRKIIVLFVLIALALCGTAYAAVPISYFDLTASDDASINEKSPTNNYGGNAELRVGKDSNKSIFSLLKFDLSAFTNIDSAYLWLYKNSGDSVTFNITPYATATGWSESSVTWNTRPAIGVAGTAVSVTPTNGWYSWDLTSFAQSAQGGALSFVLEGSGANSKYFSFSSGEGATNNPYLRVTPVVPEPISSALFLVGGAAMAVRQYRKRKKG